MSDETITLPRSILERAQHDVFLSGMVSMIRCGAPERDAMLATLGALSDALHRMTQAAVRVKETECPSLLIPAPEGSVVLGPGAREAVARALGKRLHDSMTLEQMHTDIQAVLYADADAVLRALAGTGTQAPPAGPVVAAPCQGQYHAPECRERSKPT